MGIVFELLQALGQGGDRQLLLRQRFRAQSLFMNEVSPERLIPKEGTNEGGFTCAEPGGSTACAAVVDDSGHPWKQRFMGSTLNDVHRIRDQCFRALQSAPAGGQNGSNAGPLNGL